MAQVKEYRFVFVDESTSQQSNQSLSSTLKDKDKTSGSTVKTPVNPKAAKETGVVSSIASQTVMYGVAAARIYQTMRNISYNTKTTDAVISGNLQAARHLQAKKSKQDTRINQAMRITGYVGTGIALGSMVPGVGNVIGAVLGLTTGLISEIMTMENQYREEMRRFMSEIAEQKYSGYVNSRRLVNLSGGVR